MGCSSVVMFVTQEYFGNGTSLHFIFYQVTEYWVLVAAMVFICMSSSLAIQHANCVCVCVCYTCRPHLIIVDNKVLRLTSIVNGRLSLSMVEHTTSENCAQPNKYAAILPFV